MEDRVIVIIHRRMVILVEHAVVDQLLDGFLCQIGVHCAGAIADQRRKVVHLPRLRGLDDQRHARSLLRADQMFLHRRYRQQRGDRHMVLIHAAIREDHDVHALAVGAVRLHIQAVDRALEAGILIINDRNDLDLEALAFHIPDL